MRRVLVDVEERRLPGALIVATAAERTDALQAQCAMWCRMKGLEPLDIGEGFERSWLLMAVHQTDRTFAQMNERQRRVIAGLAC